MAEPKSAKESYPRGVGTKFNIDGSVRPFAGNTIVHHLPASSPLVEPLMSLYRRLQSSPLSSLYTLLPPASWHMTIFEGVCDKARAAPAWPAELPRDAPMAECNAFWERKLSTFKTGCKPPLRMAVTGLESFAVGIGVSVGGATEDEEARLRGMRDRLSEHMSLRSPWHASYGLHISISYFIRFPTEAQKAELRRILEEELAKLPKTFELGRPEVCRFDDMFEFKRQFYLEDE